MNKIILFFLVLSFGANAQESQKTIAHLVTWKAKPGQSELFDIGYKKHLEWHASQNDTWEWYGWQIVSGERLGHFMDASFGHSWEEFDSPPVDLTEDSKDNQLHVYPFATLVNLQRISFKPALSKLNGKKLDSKYLKLITFEATNNGYAEDIFRKFNEKSHKFDYALFKLIDGGSGNKYQLFIRINSFEEYGLTENIVDEFNALEAKQKTFSSISTETLYFRKDLSLLNDDSNE